VFSILKRLLVSQGSTDHWCVKPLVPQVTDGTIGPCKGVTHQLEGSANPRRDDRRIDNHLSSTTKRTKPSPLMAHMEFVHPLDQIDAHEIDEQATTGASPAFAVIWQS
jgi:hypothetical protein